MRWLRALWAVASVRGKVPRISASDSDSLLRIPCFHLPISHARVCPGGRILGRILTDPQRFFDIESIQSIHGIPLNNALVSIHRICGKFWRMAADSCGFVTISFPLREKERGERPVSGTERTALAFSLLK